jgi:hypothetical protein
VTGDHICGDAPLWQEAVNVTLALETGWWVAWEHHRFMAWTEFPWYNKLIEHISQLGSISSTSAKTVSSLVNSKYQHLHV